MSIPSIANVVASNNTFGDWLDRSNQVFTLVRGSVMTANATTSNTTGNAMLIGVFSANTVAIVDALRGGTVAASANLDISSNVVISGTTSLVDLNVSGNVDSLSVTGSITGGDVTASGNVSANNISATGDATITGDLTVNGNTNFSGDMSSNSFSVDGLLTLQSNVVIDVSESGDLGSNTSSPQTIYTFAKATYRSVKLVVQTSNGSDTQTQEGVLVHDGGANVYLSVYGTVTTANNGTEELGELSASVNGANVELAITQNSANSRCTTIAQLIK